MYKKRAKTLNLNEATTRDTLKSERETRKSVVVSCSQGVENVCGKRDINIVNTEHARIIRMEDCLDKKIPLSKNIIK